MNSAFSETDEDYDDSYESENNYYSDTSIEDDDSSDGGEVFDVVFDQMDNLFENFVFFNKTNGDKGNFTSKVQNKVKGIFEKEKNRFMTNVNKHKENFKQKYSESRQKVRQKTRKLKDKIRHETKNPDFIRTKDKFAFTFGVINTVVMAFLLGRFPHLLPSYYSVGCVVLLALRFFLYHRSKYHYFMLDFCYFCNFLLLFYIFYYPTSSFLYTLNLVNSNGPLLWAIVAWRNSLVFHDLDKVTSVFIHAFPPLITYVLRWNPNTSLYYSTCMREDCTITFKDIIIPHICFFIYWQVTYLIKTELVDRNFMRRNKNIPTSFRWLTRSNGSRIGKFVNQFQPGFRIPAFIGLQFSYHMLTIVPHYFMFRSFWFHTVLLALVGFRCVWNGANFYIEKFSTSYRERLEQIAAELNEIEASQEEVDDAAAAVENDNNNNNNNNNGNDEKGTNDKNSASEINNGSRDHSSVHYHHHQDQSNNISNIKS